MVFNGVCINGRMFRAHLLNRFRFSEGFHANEKRDKRDQIQFIVYNSDKALAVLLVTEGTVHTCLLNVVQKNQEQCKNLCL